MVELVVKVVVKVVFFQAPLEMPFDILDALSVVHHLHHHFPFHTAERFETGVVVQALGDIAERFFYFLLLKVVVFFFLVHDDAAAARVV